MGHSVGMVVDLPRHESPRQSVVCDDEADGQQERHPVLVQGQYPDHHEEVEVHLDDPAGEMHEYGRRNDQTYRNHGGGELPTPARPGASPADSGEDGDDSGLSHRGAVTHSPCVLGERMALGKEVHRLADPVLRSTWDHAAPC